MFFNYCFNPTNIDWYMDDDGQHMQGLREICEGNTHLGRAWATMYEESKEWMLTHIFNRGRQDFSFMYMHAAVRLLFDLGLLDGEFGTFRKAIKSTADLEASVQNVMGLFKIKCGERLLVPGW